MVKNASKRAVNNGKLPFDTRGPRRKRRGGGRKDPNNENAGSGVGSKISDETELTTFDIKIRKRNQFGNELTKTRKCD